MSITPRYPRLKFPPIAPITPDDGWFDKNPSVTEFYHALSVVFPQGENFFIDSVVHYRDQIEDPKLQEQVKGFVSQEMQHSAQHVKYNQRIGQEYGHNIQAVDAFVAFILSVPKIVGTRLGLLAITCALEHFTAMMADTLLNTPKGKAALDKMPSHHRTLWIWHALEETEHKAVAYDVYLAMGGGYFRRIWVFLIVTFFFILFVGWIYIYFLWNRGILFRFRTHVAIFRFFFVDPAIALMLFAPWCDYFRKDFHPWQHNNAFLVPLYTQKLDLVETNKSH